MNQCLLQRMGSLMTCTTPSTLLSWERRRTRYTRRAELDFGFIDRRATSSQIWVEGGCPRWVVEEEVVAVEAAEVGFGGGGRPGKLRISFCCSSDSDAIRRSTSELRSFTSPTESTLKKQAKWKVNCCWSSATNMPNWIPLDGIGNNTSQCQIGPIISI